MKRMTIRCLSILCAIVALICFVQSTALAVQQFTINNVVGGQSQTQPADLVMGTRAITFRVTNTSTAGESINRIRFSLTNNTYTTLPNPETFGALPAGWSCTRSNNTRITCTGTSNFITTGNYIDFTFNVRNVNTTQDTNDQLGNNAGCGNAAASCARFSPSNTYSPPTTNNGAWRWKSLSVTLVPSSFNIGQNCLFNLTMTVTNGTTANITNPNYVTSQPNPPVMTSLSGGATVSAVSVPANIVPLNAGTSSSMTWTYTAGANLGTLNLSAYARDSTSIRTSSSVTTNTITVSNTPCQFIVSSLTATPACLLSGGIATFTMIVSNTTGNTLNSVAPTWPPTNNGAATIGAPTCTFPAGCSYASLNSGTTGTFVWTAPVTANPDYVIGQDYWVTARGTSSSATYPFTNWQDSNHQTIDGYTVLIIPLTTNAQSNNEDISWQVNNSGCALVSQVSITAVTSGWPAPSDIYSVVTNTSNVVVDTWNTAAISNGSLYTVDIPAVNRLPVGNIGTFYMFYDSTPATAQTYTFNVTVTDINGVSKTIPTAIVVNPYDPGDPNGLNWTATGVWREDIK